MTTVPSQVGAAMAEAIAGRDFAAARSLLHPEIDFRAMTPNQIWEADGPADVEAHLRKWLDDPGEEITLVEATDPAAVEDTERVGWRVHGTGQEGPFVYEQQAYLRERDGQISWMRVMCSGHRRPADAPQG